jgi:hypothetical protein
MEVGSTAWLSLFFFCMKIIINKNTPWPEMECLARLLAERGFRLSRGTWVLRDRESVPTVCIDRPEQPGWGQKWAPWYAEKQHATDAAGEAQAALALAGEAIAKWDMDAFDFPLPNDKADPADL